MRILIIILLSLIILNCDKKSSTEPDPDPEPSGELIGEATIGISGGELSAESFSLVIPAGALSSSTDLKLYVEEDSSAMGVEIASRLYKVENFPVNFQQPLEIKIKNTSELKKETAIVVAKEGTIYGLDTTYTDLTFSFYEGEISGEYVLAEIDPFISGSLEKSSSNYFAVILFGIMTNGETQQSNNNHFKLAQWNNIAIDYELQLTNEYLETAYSRYQVNSFRYNYYPTWPMGVFVNSYTNAINPQPCLYQIDVRSYTPWGHTGMTVGICSYNVFSDHQYRFDVGFLRTILFPYSFSETSRWVIGSIEKWALIKHYEWYNTFNKTSFLSAFNRSFYGVPVGDIGGSDREWGVSIMLEYLIDNYGDEELGNICDGIKNGISVAQSIVDNTSQPKNWLSDYYTNLVIGTQWKNRLQNHNEYPSFFDTNHYAEFLIGGSEENVNWSQTYDPLSAKWFKFNLAEGFNDSDELLITTEGGNAEIVVFKYDSERIDKIAEGESEVTIEELNVLELEDVDLMVLVVNRGYQSAENITLKTDLVKEYYNAALDFRVDVVEWMYVSSNGDTSYVQSDDGVRFTVEAVGRLIPTNDGFEFSASWDSTNSAAVRNYGSLVVKLDETQDNVTELVYRDKFDYPTYTLWDYKLDAFDIPFQVTQYQVYDEETCNHVSDVGWYRGSASGSYSRITEIYCGNVRTTLIVWIY